VARLLLFLVLAVVIARTFWRFVDAIMRGAGGSAPPFGSAQGRQGATRPGGPPVAVKMQQCPVCGTYVVPGKAISVVTDGRPLYFDSEKCRAEYQSR
jgi:hypothetical protein